MTDRRAAILAAAIEIADERGLDAVSMRSVAERVGVTPMALYPYVGSKQALLDGMLGTLLGEFAIRADAGGWRERLTALATAARSLTRHRPWIAVLLFSRPAIEPAAVRVVEVIYQALLEAGVAEAEVPRLERLLSTFIIGYAASEASGRFSLADRDARGRRARLPEGELPAHDRLAPWLDQPKDLDAEFEADLADLERLVEANARPRAAGQTRAGG